MYTAIEFKDATDIELQSAAKFADAAEQPKLREMIERLDLRERDREVLREYLIDKGYKSLLVESARLRGDTRKAAFGTALPLTHGADVSNRGRVFLKDLGFEGITQLMSFGGAALRYTVNHSFESTVELLRKPHDTWRFELREITPNIVCRDGRYDDYKYLVYYGSSAIGFVTVRRYVDGVARTVSHIELHPLKD